MESIIKDHLLKYLKDNNILSNKQYGFLPGWSTVLQLLNALDQRTEATDNGFYVDVIYCDFMKAFDKVPHKRLLKVLKYYCIPSKIVDWTESFLTNRKQKVIVNGIYSIIMAWCNQWCATRISFRTYPVCYLYQHTYWCCKALRFVFVCR